MAAEPAHPATRRSRAEGVQATQLSLRSGGRRWLPMCRQVAASTFWLALVLWGVPAGGPRGVAAVPFGAHQEDAGHGLKESGQFLGMGRYLPDRRVVVVPEMDSSDQHVDVFFPAANTTQPGDKFPLVVFMHGFWGGGGFTNIYYPIVSTITSYGYVVVLPRACDLACFDDRATLPGDPLGFAHYYQQQLRAIVWASEQAESATDGPFALVNSTVGVGIAGHSMGGQATLFSSAKANTTAYNIRAAVMNHPFTHTFPAPAVPFLVLTGSYDELAFPWMSAHFYEKLGACATKAFVDKMYYPHLSRCPGCKE